LIYNGPKNLDTKKTEFKVYDNDAEKLCSRFQSPGRTQTKPVIFNSDQGTKGNDEMWVQFTPSPDGSFVVDAWLPFGPGEVF